MFFHAVNAFYLGTLQHLGVGHSNLPSEAQKFLTALQVKSFQKLNHVKSFQKLNLLYYIPSQ